MNPMCSACCEKSDKKFITMCGGQEVAFYLCNKCYNIIKKEIFSTHNVKIEYPCEFIDGEKNEEI